MKDYRSDYDILKEIGLTNREIVKMCCGIDYMIYELDDFKEHFMYYMKQFDCVVSDDVKDFINLIYGKDGSIDCWDRVDFPDGDSYLVQRIL